MTKANECTCPSGDGSLRHPCPAHPAPVELAGVAANLTFINGRPAMCGCQVEYSSGGGEYSDVIYVTLCAKHSGSAILDIVATNRIALTQSSPAHELDPLGPAPHAEAFNESPDEAIRPEQAEAERPEVVAVMESNGAGGKRLAQRFPIVNVFVGDELMTVAQHERITAQLHDALDESDGDRWKLRSERDVALARVAELEHVLRVVVNAADHGSWPTTVMHGIEKVREVLAGSAPPAKAQHSVPDGYRLIRLEHFAAIKAQLNPEQVDAYRGRNIYDEDKVYANWNACRSALDEIKDVFQQIDWDAENELAELLAAAPGKEGV